MPETNLSPELLPPPEPIIDPLDHLPLRLLKSDTVPPAPTRSASTIDWLPDFSGHSWLAYGASSLLVISHLPSPLSRDETLIGPFLRQVFELSCHHSSPVNSVSWSPVCPSVGELAAASENCIFLFSPDFASSKGAFCWSQSGVLVQSNKVEALRWSGSGDGIISGGMDVVLWRRKTNMTWEIAWKFRRDVPQNLVSATWSIEGPCASASYRGDLGLRETSSVSKSVMVCYGCGNNDYAKTELGHPQPVLMVQWRPSGGRGSEVDLGESLRNVLLTCCLDGTVRLWTELDNGKFRKLGKESGDHKGIRRHFCVSAVVEINQVLNGYLGIDVFLSWATDIGGIFRIGEADTRVFSAEGYGHDKVGLCEWLIGFGPGTCVSFWAVHCLDDISPVRFPRVSLWKEQELKDFGVGAVVSNSKDFLLLNKVVTSRNSMAGPPEICSLIHLLPCGSLVWSLMHYQTSGNTEVASMIEPNMKEYSLSAASSLPLGGHSGKILQVMTHPCSIEDELAVSLDSNGLLLCWSVSTISNRKLGLEGLVPAWELRGKIAAPDIDSKYTSVRWAPSVSSEDRIILLGHACGIDCFTINISQIGEEGILCNYLCTIPLTVHGPFEDGPTNIFAIPLPSTSYETYNYVKFLLLGMWMKGFQALSWEITLQFDNLPRSSSECNFDGKTTNLYFAWKFENTIGNKRYCVGVNPCSSQLPEPYSHDQVTCFSVVCPSILINAREMPGSDEDGFPAYIMATGCSDGTLKFWRSNSFELATPYMPWELVGKLTVHEGPLSALCLTDCGQRIATLSIGRHVDGTSILRIWKTVSLAKFGTFVLEDTILIDVEVVALSWLALGNGQLVLGVCMKTGLQVYVQKRSTAQPLSNPGKSMNLPSWSCIAVGPTFHDIHDFVWGSGATAIIVHDCYFSLYSQWLSLLKNNKHVLGKADCEDDNIMDIYPSIFMDSYSELGDEEPVSDSRGNCGSLLKTRGQKECPLSSLLLARTHQDHHLSSSVGFWSMVEIAENLTGMLPVYHPEVLLMNISSGNWKRANVALRHLSHFLASSNGMEKRHNSTKKHMHIVPQILLGDYLEGLIVEDSVDKRFQWSADAQLPSSSSQIFPYNTKSDTSNSTFNSSSAESELRSFTVTLEKSCDLESFVFEKLQMLAVIDLLSEAQHSSSTYQNLDESGRRFWVALRFQQLHYSRSFGRLLSMQEFVVDSRMLSWAFNSDCQETLLNFFLPNEPSWNDMRTLGVGFWFTNAVQLRARMERLARSQYLRKKDPKDCALLYIALNRIQVLAGLFKMSKDEKDKPLVGFLARNFQEDKNKAAALKNAYVLMGRHQLELAVAFFLLGGDAYSAITICAKNLGDEQLALIICRLVESRGGPLERHLITKLILPSSIESGDYWLAGLLEWELGNYSQSLVHMFGLPVRSVHDKSALSFNHVTFVDPSIGLYCLSLTTKNSLRNAIGEQNALVLGRWATYLIATSFNRCGLPIEALEFFSTSPSIIGAMDQGTVADVDHLGVLQLLLKPSSDNWLSGVAALHLDYQPKLDFAAQYFSKLVKDHPGWFDMTVGCIQPGACSKNCEYYEEIRENFSKMLFGGISKIDQKFSVDPSSIVRMILDWLCSNGLQFVGYDVLLDYNSRSGLQEESHSGAGYRHLLKPLWKAGGDISILLSRFIISCSITCFQPKSLDIESDRCIDEQSLQSYTHSFKGLIPTLWTFRASLRIFSGFLEDVTRTSFVLLDLFEYIAYFALSWMQKSPEGLLLMVTPLLTSFTSGESIYDIDMEKLKNSLCQIEEILAHQSSKGGPRTWHEASSFLLCKQEQESMQSFSEDEIWHILRICLWQHMHRLVDHKLGLWSFELEDSCIPGVTDGKVFVSKSCLTNLDFDCNNLTENKLLDFVLSKFLKAAVAHLSSYYVKLLISSLQQKIEENLHVVTWLKESRVSQAKSLGPDVSDEVSSRNGLPTFDVLWDFCADPNVISKAFEQEKIESSLIFRHRSSKSWTGVYKGIIGEHDHGEVLNPEVKLGHHSSADVVSPPKGLFKSGRTLFSAWQKDVNIVKELSGFHHAKEIFKRDGELFEVMCINSVNECQAAVSSNRKGIVFLSLKDEVSFGDSSDYIWSNVDWPPNGWAGSESTPVPTFVSPGVGLGKKKGAHLGLGGATVGMGSLARPRRDLTGGAAFGIPGYAGIGASGLGWEVQEDFDEFVDAPATVENIRTRAFSSHPYRAVFLVGSSNTHVYLWEFGKDKATATYGVLPAANVPPPYALASVSAVQFDHSGHRFASAALDGTVCTWQLEVGGRSNVRPTESSLCFNGHASDVTYVTSSGSIIATAGYSSSGVSVVIWDTLAPPTTSRASIVCHEGGARSISVFDNAIGSGSISPLIVTGGKSGDVGLHDFRYIATGQTKRHRQIDNGDISNNVSNTDTKVVNNKIGDQNIHGMLWYIPKAHLGSVTKISAIPHTSLFLTGSKDGDVKLWDAKAAKLVYHWPKLHERRTFLQPSSRGFGGVVRAGVTDIQVVSHGFLTCGGDGTVKLIQPKDLQLGN